MPELHHWQCLLQGPVQFKNMPIRYNVKLDWPLCSGSYNKFIPSRESCDILFFLQPLLFFFFSYFPVFLFYLSFMLIYQPVIFLLFPHLEILENIRIYHECEGRIEKSVPRITVWHHEACQVMTNGDPEGRIFLSYSHPNNGFFFLLTITYHILFLRKGSEMFLNTPRWDML